MHVTHSLAVLCSPFCLSAMSTFCTFWSCHPVKSMCAWHCPFCSHQPRAAITILPPVKWERRWRLGEPCFLPHWRSLATYPLSGCQVCCLLSLGPRERELTGHRSLLLLFLVVLHLLTGQLPELRKVCLQQLGDCFMGQR